MSSIHPVLTSSDVESGVADAPSANGEGMTQPPRLGMEERYRLLAETMLQGVVHHDAAGQIIEMNPAA